jgi:hypothetical protein
VIIGAYPSPGGGLYSAEGHQVAHAVFVAIEICGFAWFIWPRRKKAA